MRVAAWTVTLAVLLHACACISASTPPSPPAPPTPPPTPPPPTPAPPAPAQCVKPADDNRAWLCIQCGGPYECSLSTTADCEPAEIDGCPLQNMATSWTCCQACAVSAAYICRYDNGTGIPLHYETTTYYTTGGQTPPPKSNKAHHRTVVALAVTFTLLIVLGGTAAAAFFVWKRRASVDRASYTAVQ